MYHMLQIKIFIDKN